MKKLISLSLGSLLLLSLIFLFVSTNTIATQENHVHREEYVPNEVFVRFKKGVHRFFIQEAINSVQGKIITYLRKEITISVWDPVDISLRSFRSDPDLFHLKVPKTIDTELAIYLLNQNPNVK